ncbi:hypothetical protein GALL_484380 [mine drainage metagenome]|uniref:Uncharacterized protein n=1 Tax=mine drainage metagenome TaxID=410659 RepID=A0A1J5PXB2_9ZZZZ
MRVGDVEEVVARDADAHVRRALGTQRSVHEPDEVRVHLRLGPVRRLRPAVQLRLDLLHREVRALDETDLDPRSARGPAPCGDRGQLVERGDRIGQVRLQHDPGLDLQQVPVHQQLLEDLHRERQVAVLLHVQVEERPVACGGQVQRP